MKTNSKWISCILALMVIGTSAVWAQKSDFDEFITTAPASPQNVATVELTGTEVDQFMDVTGWSDVKFGKAFTFAGFSSNRSLDLGAAFKAGPVYIGSWYQGNIAAFSGTDTKSVTTRVSENSAVPGTIGNTNTKSESSVTKTYNPTHSAAVLLGFGNVGIKFGYLRSETNKSGTYYKESMETDFTTKKDVTTKDSNTPEALNSTVYSPKGYVNRAQHAPFIGFGMNVGLGKMTLSPAALLAIGIKQESEYGLKTIEQKTDSKHYSTTKEVSAKGKSYTAVIGKIGTGLDLGDSLNSSLSFGYDFEAHIYGNTYTDAAGTKQKVKGTYINLKHSVENHYNTPSYNGSEAHVETFSAQMTNKNFFKNTLSLGYTMKKDFTDRLAFHAGVNLPLSFGFTKEVTESKDETTKTVNSLIPGDLNNSYVEKTAITKPKETYNTQNIHLQTQLKAAISYAALPGRLFLNLGADATVLNWESTTKKTKYDSFVEKTETTTTYKSGKVEKTTASTSLTDANEEKSFKKDELHRATVGLTAGLRWNLVENVGIDLVYFNQNIANMDTSNLGIFKLACTVKF